MKKVLIIGFALVLLGVGDVLAGAFDFASTTGEKFKNTVVLELFSAEDVDTAATVYSDWVKIADCNNEKAIFWVSGVSDTTDSTATYQFTLQVTPEEDSSYIANATVFDTINSGTRTIVALDLTDYAFPWARLRVARVDVQYGISSSSALTVYMALERNDIFHIPIYPPAAMNQFFEYDTDTGP